MLCYFLDFLSLVCFLYAFILWTLAALLDNSIRLNAKSIGEGIPGINIISACMQSPLKKRIGSTVRKNMWQTPSLRAF